MPSAGAAPYAQRHDLELCAQAVTGDRVAFGELARRHGGAVRALLRRMGAQPAEADDLAQDAFLAAFERIAEFRGEGAFAGWVKRIAARLYLRRLQRDRRLAELAVDAEAPAAGADADGRLDLDAGLKGLSAAERLCVSLCYGRDSRTPKPPRPSSCRSAPSNPTSSVAWRSCGRALRPPYSSRPKEAWTMAELDFDRQLERLFAEAPPMADAQAFAARLERRLERRWRLRRVLIGAAGVAGGVIGVSQLIGSGVASALRSAEASAVALPASLAQTSADRWAAILPRDGDVVWTALAVAVVLMSFVLTRVIEEF